MVQNFHIRAATVDDLQKICKIEDASFSHDPYPAFLFERLLNNEHSLFYVATDQTDEIIGYLVSKIEDHNAHLISLAVFPIQRRLGVATRLLEALIATVRKRKIHEVRLEVRPDNKAAIQLYTQFKFSEETIIPQYYSDGSPASLMRKVIE